MWNLHLELDLKIWDRRNETERLLGDLLGRQPSLSTILVVLDKVISVSSMFQCCFTPASVRFNCLAIHGHLFPPFTHIFNLHSSSAEYRPRITALFPLPPRWILSLSESLLAIDFTLKVALIIAIIAAAALAINTHSRYYFWAPSCWLKSLCISVTFPAVALWGWTSPGARGVRMGASWQNCPGVFYSRVAFTLVTLENSWIKPTWELQSQASFSVR